MTGWCCICIWEQLSSHGASLPPAPSWKPVWFGQEHSAASICRKHWQDQEPTGPESPYELVRLYRKDAAVFQNSWKRNAGTFHLGIHLGHSEVQLCHQRGCFPWGPARPVGERTNGYDHILAAQHVEHGWRLCPAGSVRWPCQRARLGVCSPGAFWNWVQAACAHKEKWCQWLLVVAYSREHPGQHSHRGHHLCLHCGGVQQCAAPWEGRGLQVPIRAFLLHWIAFQEQEETSLFQTDTCLFAAYPINPTVPFEQA